MTDDATTDNAKPCLLFADDSRVMRVSAERILQDQFELVFAEHGEQAWEILLRDPRIQAVFTDLAMPLLDGYRLLDRIRESDEARIRRLPVIILTGKEGDDARADALRRGATDFISKPFNKIDLVARAQSHAANTQAQRDLEENTTVDPLTRLGNAQYFHDQLGQDQAFGMRHAQPYSIVLLEIRNIAGIAAKAGREAATQLIKQVGSIVRVTIRQEDSAARVDTARFAISLPACDDVGATLLTERLQRVLTAANERHAAQSQALRIAITSATPSLAPGTEAQQALAELEHALAASEPRGIDVIDPPKSPAASTPTAPSKPPPEPAPTASSPPRADPAPSLDEALQLIRDKRTAQVRDHVGTLLNQLLPLLRLTSVAQREKMIAFLKSLRD